jgi:hypothetical protein
MCRIHGTFGRRRTMATLIIVIVVCLIIIEVTIAFSIYSATSTLDGKLGEVITELRRISSSVESLSDSVSIEGKGEGNR